MLERNVRILKIRLYIHRQRRKTPYFEIVDNLLIFLKRGPPCWTLQNWPKIQN